jgi:hypothetical protein
MADIANGRKRGTVDGGNEGGLGDFGKNSMVAGIINQLEPGKQTTNAVPGSPEKIQPPKRSRTVKNHKLKIYERPPERRLSGSNETLKLQRLWFSKNHGYDDACESSEAPRCRCHFSYGNTFRRMAG